MNAPYTTDKNSPAYGRSLEVLMAFGIGSQIASMIRQMPTEALVGGVAKLSAATDLNQETADRLAACRAELNLRSN
jgi:hypothetical protein